jgi:hypothetical protein
MKVDVEVLDVSDEDGRTLLLSIDPLAALTQTQEQLQQRLMELAPPVLEELTAAWRHEALSRLAAVSSTSPEVPAVPEQFLILVTCRDE